MPDRNAIRRAQRDRQLGKSASTQAGEFVREEMDHIRQGKHGARSAKQAIAIGLSEARRAGVELPAPKRGSATQKARKKATTDLASAKNGVLRTSAKRAQASKQALKREGRAAASPAALSRQAHGAAQALGPVKRSASAGKAARTKAKAGASELARKQPARKKSTTTASRKLAVTSNATAKKSPPVGKHAGASRTKLNKPSVAEKTPGNSARAKSAELIKPAKSKSSPAQQKKLAARHLWELVEQKKNHAAQQPAWRALENSHGGTLPGAATAGDTPAPTLPQVEMHGHRDRGGG